MKFFFIIKNLSFVLLIFIFLIKYCCANNGNLIKDLSKTGEHNIFISIIENNPLFLSLISNTVKSTIYAPTDDAFNAMPSNFKNEIKKNNIKYTTKMILTHIFDGNNLKKSNNSPGMVLTLDGSIYYTYEIGDLFVKDIVTQGKYFMSGNYTIIPVGCVMFLQQSSKDIRLDKKIQEKYKFTSCCLQTEDEYNEFILGL